MSAISTPRPPPPVPPWVKGWTRLTFKTIKFYAALNNIDIN